MAGSTSTFDAAAYKQKARTEWRQAAAGWREHVDLVEANSHDLNEAIVEHADIGLGDHVLDVGCGYGEPTLTIAKVVGPRGQVVGQDLSDGMLAFARERAAEAGHDHVELIEGDIEEAEFEAESFDAVVSRQGLQYLVDVPAAFRRFHRWLKPGGRLSAASWGAAPTVTFAAVPFQAIMAELDLEPPESSGPGIFALSDPDVVRAYLEGAGFTDIEIGTGEWIYGGVSAEAFVDALRKMAPPITALVEAHPPEAQERAWRAVTEALREYEDNDGSVVTRNQYVWFTGAKE